MRIRMVRRVGVRKPAAKRSTLILVAGLLWSAVGLLLMTIAGFWLSRGESWQVWLLAPAGFLLGWLHFRKMFEKLVGVNISRIEEQAPGHERVCVFAFQNIRSYLIAFLMMAMGYALRHSPIPKVYLAPLYLAVGVGLFSSSVAYYRRVRRA